MNTFLEKLQQRVSVPADMLVEPAPSQSELEQIIQAAVCVPDFGALRPWRFLSIAGAARDKLGQLFCDAAVKKNPGLDDTEQATIKAKALRSPLILAVVAAVQNHPKISADEQICSAAAAAETILLAANALEFGAIWLTGPFAADPLVCKGLGLAPQERIVAFIYLGTPSERAEITKKKIKNRPKAADFIYDWKPD